MAANVGGKQCREMVAGSDGGRWWRETMAGDVGGRRWRETMAGGVGGTYCRQKELLARPEPKAAAFGTARAESPLH